MAASPLLGLVALLQAPPAPDADSVALVGIRAKAPVTTETADLLTDRVTAGFKQHGRFRRVVGAEELRATLNLQQQQQLFNCDATQCMTEVAGALNVQWIVLGSVGRLGNQWLLSLKVVNARTSEAAHAVSHNASGDESVLLTLTDNSVREVLDQMHAVRAAAAGVPPPAAAVTAPTPSTPVPPAPAAAPAPAPRITDASEEDDPEEDELEDEDAAPAPRKKDRPAQDAVSERGWPTWVGLGGAAAALGLGALALAALWAHVLVPISVPDGEAYSWVLLGTLCTALPVGVVCAAATGVTGLLAAVLYAVRLPLRKAGGPLWARPAPLVALLTAFTFCGGVVSLLAGCAFAVGIGVTEPDTRSGPYVLQNIFVPGALGSGMIFLVLNGVLLLSVVALAVSAVTDMAALPLLGTSG